MASGRKISNREFLAYRAEVRGQIFRQIHKRLALLKSRGLTQRSLAARLGIDEGQLSRCLRGENDLRLETLSDLARALGCRIDATLTPLDRAFEGYATAAIEQDDDNRPIEEC